MSEIFTMIVSAIVGGIAWWGFTAFIIPVVVGALNKAPKISGSWNYFDSEGSDIVGTAKISQTGNRLKVTATRIKSRDGVADNREFIYKGTVNGRDIVLKYEQKDGGGFICGALVLRLDASLNNMSGVTSYYSDSAASVITHNIYYAK